MAALPKRWLGSVYAARKDGTVHGLAISAQAKNMEVWNCEEIVQKSFPVALHSDGVRSRCPRFG